jgi:hypothetical protein
MTYGATGIAAQIHRRGGEAQVLTRGETGQNEFGNMTDDYTPDRSVLAAKTYPNRNTQVESNVGDRGQDRPVFMVPIGDNQPDPPAEEDHIVYDGQEYEVKSHTPYDTHVEFFAEPVIHDEDGE